MLLLNTLQLRCVNCAAIMWLLRCVMRATSITKYSRSYSYTSNPSISDKNRSEDVTSRKMSDVSTYEQKTFPKLNMSETLTINVQELEDHISLAEGES